MKVLSMPMSTYHIKLLSDNYQDIDCFLMKNNLLDNKLEKYIDSNVFYYKEETLERNFVASWINNKKKYNLVKEIIDKNAVDKVIVFSDNKPILKFIIDYCKDKNIIIELWEDGLGHYIGSGQKYKFILKSFVKLLFGFYSKRIFCEQTDRSQIMIRDRFEYKNLAFKRNISLKIQNTKSKILFIGQPLVEDGYISLKKYQNKLEYISEYFKLEIDYLPHPREDISKYRGMKLNVINTSLSAEDYCNKFKYNFYFSVFSTSNINIENQNNYYLASFFGLMEISKKLDAISYLSIKNIYRLKEIDFEN